ncbi:hypothetical protein QBC44DRAFT_375803 [Cladorrhinum sp. PSN332]|nr:hypothetical protein QBC44DRAFT_375803 [Cladorrhinum sp. PSN332]
MSYMDSAPAPRTEKSVESVGVNGLRAFLHTESTVHRPILDAKLRAEANARANAEADARNPRYQDSYRARPWSDYYRPNDPRQSRSPTPPPVGSQYLAMLDPESPIFDAQRDDPPDDPWNPIPSVRNLKEEDIQPKIDAYLKAIRTHLPHIVVSNVGGMATKNGSTTKRDCSSVYDNPQAAGVIELNGSLVGDMVTACRWIKGKRETDDDVVTYRTLHLRLFHYTCPRASTPLHPLPPSNHQQHTPPGVNYGYAFVHAGESGRFWEAALLGGVVEMRFDSKKAWILDYDEVIRPLVKRQFRLLNESLPESDRADEYLKEKRKSSWVNNYLDPFDEDDYKEANRGPQKLESRQVGYLISAQLRDKRKYQISGRDLAKSSQQPFEGLPVTGYRERLIEPQAVTAY